MLCIFQDEKIFEKVAVISLQKFDLIIGWGMKIYPYGHLLLHTPSSWYDSFVDFTDSLILLL